MPTRGFNAWRWQYWGGPLSHPTVTRYFGSFGVTHTVHTAIAEADDLLAAVFWSWGYNVKSAGAHNDRKITGGTVWSSHAWGISIDINPGDNPYTHSGLVTDIPLDLIRDVYRIRTNTGQRVWKWGGDWDGDWDFDEHTVWDAMHFECIATPAELSTGVVFDGTLNPEVHAMRYVKKGDKGPDVEFWQHTLKIHNPDLLPKYGVDGDYGGEVAAGVASICGGNGERIGPKEAAQLLAVPGPRGLRGPRGPQGLMGVTPNLSDYRLVQND